MNINSSSEIILIVIIAIWIAINMVHTHEIPKFDNNTDKEILDHLLNQSRYDRRTRPNKDVTPVNVSVLILTLSSPDESSVKYEIEFLMHQTWFDQRLQFNDNKAHTYLNALMHSEMLWMPDTYFIKHGEFKYPVDHFHDPVHMSLKIFPNGTVAYTTRRNMILTCEGNFKIFPFDSPKCLFAIESVSLEKTQLKLQWDPNMKIKTSDSLKKLNAYLIRNETGDCKTKHSWRTEFSCLSVLLVFSRDKQFYISTVFLPGMVLVTSSFISFWLDVNAVPARVMIGVTTMLNFCTTTNSFRSSLPVVSNLTAMNLWDFMCLFFIYGSMIEFIIVNYLHRQSCHQYAASSRPTSGHRQSFVGDYWHGIRNQHPSHPNGKRLIDSGIYQDHSKDEHEVKAPLVSGDDPSIVSYPVNHRQQQHAPPPHPSQSTPFSPKTKQQQTSANTSIQDDDRAKAAASVFAWLRRPQIFRSTELSSKARLAKKIDHISKTVFTLLFILFAFFFFLTYAVIKPAQLDDWIEKEFESDTNETISNISNN